MRSLTLITITLALLLVPMASAQIPAAPTPSYRLELLNAPGAFTGLASTNATATAPVQVVLTLSNVVCAAAVSIPVTITVTSMGAPAFFSALADPEVINITISEGPHGSPPVGTPGGGAGDTTIRAIIAGNITANASVPVEVKATAPAPPSGPGGCQGAGAISAAESAPVTIYANMTAEVLPPPPPTPEADSPGFGLVAALAAIAGVALWTRRRNVR